MKRKLSIGYFFPLVGFILAIAAAVMYYFTFDAFHYSMDRSVTAFLFIALWCYLWILLIPLFLDDDPLIMNVLYAVAIFALTLSALKFLVPCLSPIGIYFTVHNMGDVEANAIGVPRSIICLVLYVLSIFGLLLGSIVPAKGKEKTV